MEPMIIDGQIVNSNYAHSFEKLLSVVVAAPRGSIVNITVPAELEKTMFAKQLKRAVLLKFGVSSGNLSKNQPVVHIPSVTQDSKIFSSKEFYRYVLKTMQESNGNITRSNTNLSHSIVVNATRAELRFALENEVISRKTRAFIMEKNKYMDSYWDAILNLVIATGSVLVCISDCHPAYIDDLGISSSRRTIEFAFSWSRS